MDWKRMESFNSIFIVGNTEKKHCVEAPVQYCMAVPIVNQATLGRSSSNKILFRCTQILICSSLLWHILSYSFSSGCHRQTDRFDCLPTHIHIPHILRYTMAPYYNYIHVIRICSSTTRTCVCALVQQQCCWAIYTCIHKIHIQAHGELRGHPSAREFIALCGAVPHKHNTKLILPMAPTALK